MVTNSLASSSDQAEAQNCLNEGDHNNDRASNNYYSGDCWANEGFSNPLQKGGDKGLKIFTEFYQNIYPSRASISLFVGGILLSIRKRFKYEGVPASVQFRLSWVRRPFW